MTVRKTASIWEIEERCKQLLDLIEDYKRMVLHHGIEPLGSGVSGEGDL